VKQIDDWWQKNSKQMEASSRARFWQAIWLTFFALGWCALFLQREFTVGLLIALAAFVGPIIIFAWTLYFRPRAAARMMFLTLLLGAVLFFAIFLVSLGFDIDIWH
jgi:hypothetical protein